jgi:hypothetical protein
VTHTLIAAALALTLAGCVTDTLADLDIELSPELVALGIEPGARHERPAPQFDRYLLPFPPISVRP